MFFEHLWLNRLNEDLSIELHKFPELNLLDIIFTAIVSGIAIALLRSQEQTQKVGELIYGVSKGLSEA